VVARLGDEDVVQRRPHELQRLHGDAGLVERADDAGNVGGPVLHLHQDLPPVLGRQQLADRSEYRLGFHHRALGQLQLDVGMADVGLERLRRPFGDDAAAVDDADVVGELVGLLQVLRGEEDRRTLVVERPHLLPDGLATDRVEAGRRLVEEEDAGLVHQRRGEVEAPLHAARIGADAAIGGGDEVDPLQQVVGAAPALRRRDTLQRRLQADQLAAGHQRVERRFLQGDADRGAHRPRLLDDVVAGDGGAAAGGQQQRRQHPHGRRLAGAVGPEETVDLALLDRDLDPLHRQQLPEGALQSLDDDRLHR
jgi:hypothetical protein